MSDFATLISLESIIANEIEHAGVTPFEIINIAIRYLKDEDGRISDSDCVRIFNMIR
jgi:hypothetical protein